MKGTTMKTSSLLTCIVLLFASTAAAQTPEPQKKQAELSTWKTYTIKNEKVSARFPTHPAMTTNTRYRELLRQSLTDRMVGAYADGVVYGLYTYENREPRDSFENFLSRQLDGKDVANLRNVKIGRFSGKEYSFDGFPQTMWFFAVEDRFYKFTAMGATTDDPGVKQFFSSITFDRKGEIEVFDGPGILLPGTGEAAPAPSVEVPTGSGGGIDSGTGSASPSIGIGPGLGPGVGPGTGIGPGTGSSSGILTGKQVDQKVRLAMKPEPRYTEDARQHQITGTVIFKVVLASNGAVTNIRTVQGLPYGLTEQAIGAARKIKFIPAIKDGKFVSMWMQLEYNFNLY